MDRLNVYAIDLKAMASSGENYSFAADDAFFASVQGDEIQHGDVRVDLQITHASGVYQVGVRFEGHVEVVCDRCLDPMRQLVEGQAELRIRMGEEYADDGETIVVPEDKGIVDLSWQIYEQIALQIPLRHVHEDGACREEMRRVLSEHEAYEGAESQVSEASADGTDPRWDALKQLITTNN